MIRFMRSAPFQEWLDSPRGKPVRARVLTRLDNAMRGNFGDCETVGNGVSEMRILRAKQMADEFEKRSES